MAQQVQTSGQQATGYNVQLGVRIEDSQTDLDEILRVFASAHETEPALVGLVLRVIDGAGGYIWAVLEGVVEADSPATAAQLVERWMTQAGQRLPGQDSWSGGLWAHSPFGSPPLPPSFPAQDSRPMAWA